MTPSQGIRVFTERPASIVSEDMPASGPGIDSCLGKDRKVP